MNINHRDWTHYDNQGQIAARNMQVHRYDDGTTRIGSTLHRTDDLAVSDDGRSIESLAAGWTLAR